MTLAAADCAGWPDFQALHSEGFAAVGLYLNGNLTFSTMTQAASVGMGIWAFWERWASDPNGGSYQGVIDANAACDAADQKGVNRLAGIYMPNDQIVTDWNATIAYFQASANTIAGRGRVPAFYGQTVVWDQITRFGYKYFCHGGEQVSLAVGANIVQSTSPQRTIAGTDYDINTIYTADFGGFNSNGLWPAHAPTSEVVSVDMPLVVYGNKGKIVIALQKVLNGYGAKLAVDGVYGVATDKAVRWFQKSHGIAPAGHFGAESWTAVGFGQWPAS